MQSALRLLAPPPERRDECERSINMALDVINREATAAAVGSKKHKAALRRLQDSLRRAEIARRKLLGPEREWSERGHADEGLPPLALAPWMAYCERQLPWPRPRSFRRSDRKYHAVERADCLLQDWGHPAGITRGGKWAKLAAVLYGDPQADLFGIMRRLRVRRFIFPSRLIHRRT
jgi:hypothetical protein